MRSTWSRPMPAWVIQSTAWSRAPLEDLLGELDGRGMVQVGGRLVEDEDR